VCPLSRLERNIATFEPLLTIEDSYSNLLRIGGLYSVADARHEVGIKTFRSVFPAHSIALSLKRI
jgi:hypothetical protein